MKRLFEKYDSDGLQEGMTSKSKLDPKELKYIRRLEDSGAHTEAYAAAAKMLGYVKSGKIFDLILQIAKMESGESGPLWTYKVSVKKDMFKQAEKDLSKEDFTLFASHFD